MVEKMGLYKYLFFSQVLSILIPALIFLYLYHRENFLVYIKAKMPKMNLFFMYSVMLLFLAYPLIQFSYTVNKKLPIANWFSDQSQFINSFMADIMHINSFMDFITKIFLVALIPAVSEELFFRAGIQNELTGHMKNKDIAIILAAILFSAVHFQFDGFLPRFFLGLILGYVYYWSQSIWVSMTIHFLNNALLIVGAYLQQDQIDEIINEPDAEKLPLHILLMSIVAVFVLRHKMYTMWKEINNPPIEENNV